MINLFSKIPAVGLSCFPDSFENMYKDLKAKGDKGGNPYFTKFVKRSVCIMRENSKMIQLFSNYQIVINLFVLQ